MPANRSLGEEIERTLSARLGRPCLFTPSGRIALYVALRAHLAPGARVLMSPHNDDVVFFIVLAAGLRPVMASLSAEDGNIAPSLVPDCTWNSVDAVLTTNLYGLPDRVVELRERCDRLGILLVEDAAHALGIDVGGRPIGTFGEAAAFSLSKHVGVAGGVVVFAEGGHAQALARLRATTMVSTSLGLRAENALRAAKRLVYLLKLRRHARRMHRWLLDERQGNYRMPVRAERLSEAVASARAAGREEGRLDTAARNLDRFDSWARVDRHGYRMPVPRAQLRRILARLADLDRDRARRVAAVERLRELDLVAPAARRGPALPLFRVPLLVEDRDLVRAELERHDIYVGYLYDPPLDDYAGPTLTEVSPAPEAARWWARHVLPVDPLEADQVIAALKHIRPVVSPAS
jgi:dTDP-4-amino-4,6-dideoxygalactose transaminase